MLELEAEATVISRHQRRYIDDTPWSMQTSFYPMRFAEQAATMLLRAEDISEGVTRYLEGTIGVKQAGYSDKITARPPSYTEAEFFRLPADGRVAVFRDLPDGS